jgi:hypothetical protein
MKKSGAWRAVNKSGAVVKITAHRKTWDGNTMNLRAGTAQDAFVYYFKAKREKDQRIEFLDSVSGDVFATYTAHEGYWVRGEDAPTFKATAPITKLEHSGNVVTVSVDRKDWDKTTAEARQEKAANIHFTYFRAALAAENRVEFVDTTTGQVFATYAKGFYKDAKK